MLRDADGRRWPAAPAASGTLTVAGRAPVGARATATSTTWRCSWSTTVGDVVDSYHQPVGVRTVDVDGTRFLINGEPFHFTGFGMHEDHDGIGKGHNDALMLQDFELLDWIGANSFRTSHYPYSEDGPGLRRPARHRHHRRDRRRRAEHGPGRRDLRRPGLHHVLPGDDQRRDPRGARAGDPRARRPGQEPPQRGALVDRQRAGVGHRGRRAVLRAAVRGRPRSSTRPGRSGSST